MPFPYRSLKNIQPLPSIYTAFPVNHDPGAQTSIDSAINSGTCLIRHIEDGIEVVPFERCKSASAPILSPDQGEKEVFFESQTEVEAAEKPLPSLPGNAWQRMSFRQRILALLFTQFLILMAIGLALLAAKRRSLQNDSTSQARTAGNETAHTTAIRPIQRGTFAISVQSPQQQSSACLANTNESAAWQCASNTSFQLSILPSPADETSTTFVTVGPLLGNGSLRYGTRPFDLPLSQLTELANDTFHFSSTYNKTVYLTDTDLNPSNQDSQTGQSVPSQEAFEPGDSLWRCMFYETSIQGYIYTDQSATTTEMNETKVPYVATAGIPNLSYVIKIVEESTPDVQAAYCERAVVQNDGSITIAATPETVYLAHSGSERKHRTRRRSKSFRRAQTQIRATKSCRCEWLVQKSP